MCVCPCVCVRWAGIFTCARLFYINSQVIYQILLLQPLRCQKKRPVTQPRLVWSTYIYLTASNRWDFFQTKKHLNWTWIIHHCIIPWWGRPPSFRLHLAPRSLDQPFFSPKRIANFDAYPKCYSNIYIYIYIIYYIYIYNYIYTQISIAA